MYDQPNLSVAASIFAIKKEKTAKNILDKKVSTTDLFTAGIAIPIL